MDVFEGSGAEGADCTPALVTEADLRLSQLSCERGLTCRLHLRSDAEPMGVCEARADASCSHAFDCGPSQRCNLPRDWVPGRWGTCQPRRADGWGCAVDNGEEDTTLDESEVDAMVDNNGYAAQSSVDALSESLAELRPAPNGGPPV